MDEVNFLTLGVEHVDLAVFKIQHGVVEDVIAVVVGVHVAVAVHEDAVLGQGLSLEALHGACRFAVLTLGQIFAVVVFTCAFLGCMCNNRVDVTRSTSAVLLLPTDTVVIGDMHVQGRNAVERIDGVFLAVKETLADVAAAQCLVIPRKQAMNRSKRTRSRTRRRSG